MLPTLQMLPITLRHHYDFGAERGLVGDDLIRPEAWDALRTQTSGPFALPADRDVWEAAADNPALRARAEVLSRWLDELGVRRLASYGVGTGGLELWLHRLAPARQLVVTEYAPETVARLGRHFQGVEVRPHDLLADRPVEKADLHLFHRVDTEFDNRQWRAIVGRFADVRLLLVAAEILGPRALVNEMRTRLTRRTSSRAGWLRNRPAFRALWRTTHAATPARIADLEGWLLTPIRPDSA
jgi:hypothetical protein